MIEAPTGERDGPSRVQNMYVLPLDPFLTCLIRRTLSGGMHGRE